jgi:prolyl oligopeptidase
VVKTSPARFDATGLTVDQFEVASTDGTKVPYFVVHRKDAPLDGATPTLMTAYGGFEASMTPYYSGITGKLWLERGGAFVLANIRGGGEFGPKWHEAGRKTKRQIIYDDFASVARDLFARRITGAKKLGIYGGSNGGLLMGVELTQHPELWGAVTIQVPLLDMLRYEQIAAGASWVDEYGSVSVPEERAFLAKISPYHNLRRGTAYPEPYIWTTTKDDRVGPQQARKFAARMKEYGLPYLFYEDTAGGHSGDADIAQGARLQALQAVYFTQKLVDAR